DRQVWRWRRGMLFFTRVPVNDAIQTMGTVADMLVMTTPRSLTTMDDDVLTVTPIQAGTAIYLDRTMAVVRGDRQQLSIVDLHSAASVALPDLVWTGDAAADAHHIALVTDMDSVRHMVTIWSIDVPHAPFALAGW